MNRLTRNVAFCVKNNYKTLATSNTVRPKLIICRNFSIRKQCAVSKLLCERIRHNTTFATQALQFSSDASTITITQFDYEKFCVETLDNLGDYIEELVESVNHLSSADVLNKVNQKWTIMSLLFASILTCLQCLPIFCINHLNYLILGWRIDCKLRISIWNLCD